MRLNVLLHTGDYRGDHTADVCEALDVTPETTIRDLVSGHMGKRGSYVAVETEWIAIRVATEVRREEAPSE